MSYFPPVVIVPVKDGDNSKWFATGYDPRGKPYFVSEVFEDKATAIRSCKMWFQVRGWPTRFLRVLQ